MSRLHANEAGRVIAPLGEEVDGRRHVRTRLPVGEGPATLHVLARSHRPDGPPLHVQVGGRHVGAIPPRPDPILTWHELALPAEDMAGDIILSSQGDGMSGWTLAVDHTCGGGDLLSVDGGRTWNDQRIGHLHVAPGRYVIRARASAGHDPPPPTHAWEDLDNPAVEVFRRRLPSQAVDAGDPWTTVRALSTWVCRSWTYRNTGEALQYAPWDPATILEWGAGDRGHGGHVPVVMCVHYAVVLAAACQALGIPARCAALTGSLNGFNGHFVTEVWMQQWGRWVMVDPTFDVTVADARGPLDLRAIRELGADLREHVDAGEGIDDRLATTEGRAWFEENFLRGVCFRNRSLWPRSDFVSRPDQSPPGHGATAYSELDLIWEERNRAEFGMFRWFADEAWFDAPPSTAAAEVDDAQ